MVGLHGHRQPLEALEAKYGRTMKDDSPNPAVHNGRGTLVFVASEPDSRTTQIAINLAVRERALLQVYCTPPFALFYGIELSDV